MDTDNPQGTGLNDAQAQIAAMLDPEEGQLADDGEEGLEEEAQPEESDEPEGSEEEEGTEDEEVPRFTVKVDGEEVEVPLDELINGYSRQSDYTKKTQELAEERKAIQAERDQLKEVEQERVQYAHLLKALQDSLEAEPAEPDWDKLYQENPAQFAYVKHKWDSEAKARQSQRAAVRSEQERVMKLAQQEAERTMRSTIEAEEARLPEVIPEWKDAKRRETEWAAIKATFGDGVDTVTEAAGKAILRDAWLYRQGRAKAPAKVAPTLRPGAPVQKTPDVTKARERLARTGRIDDAASLISKII